MSEMVERVARAYINARAARVGEGTFLSWEESDEYFRAVTIQDFRAAIAAMRESPESVMLDAVVAAANPETGKFESLSIMWRGMIDAALK